MSSYQYDLENFSSLDNDDDDDDQEEPQQEHQEEPQQQQQQDHEDEKQNFSRQEEVTDSKTSVKTVISMSGNELDQAEALNEEVVARMVPTENNKEASIFSCYECNKVKVKLLPVITEDQKRAYCCLKCIANATLDIHFTDFLDDNQDYNGTFHNYLDKQKA